jgi:hypothetical protein
MAVQSIAFVIDDEVVSIHQTYVILTIDHRVSVRFVGYLNEYQTDHGRAHDAITECRFHPVDEDEI